jgi:hypothetical protein
VQPQEETLPDGTLCCWISAGIKNNIWQGTAFKLADLDGLDLGVVIAVEVTPFWCLAALSSDLTMSLVGARAYVQASAGPLSYEIHDTYPSTWRAREISTGLAQAIIKGSARMHRSATLARGGLGGLGSPDVVIRVNEYLVTVNHKIFRLQNLGDSCPEIPVSLARNGVAAIFHAIARVHDLLSLQNPTLPFTHCVNVYAGSSTGDDGQRGRRANVWIHRPAANGEAGSLSLVIENCADHALFAHVAVLDTTTYAVKCTGVANLLPPRHGTTPSQASYPSDASATACSDVDDEAHRLELSIPFDLFPTLSSRTLILKVFLTDRATSLAHMEQDGIFSPKNGAAELLPIDELKYGLPRGGTGLTGTRWDVITKIVDIRHEQFLCM